MARCAECRCEFLFPQPSDAWLVEEYEEYFQKRNAQFDRPKESYFRSLLVRVGEDFSHKRVLELGSGQGDCVAALTRLSPSVRITAVDSNPESGAYHAQLPCEYVHRSVEEWLADTSDVVFDVILLFDLLEHLRSPLQSLRALVGTHLREHGIVIASFPNVDSWSRRFLATNWPQYKVEHLHYFSRLSVAQTAIRCGLTTKQLTPLTKSLPLDYLLSVGSSSGPSSVRHLSRMARRFLPPLISKRSFSLSLGEWLWIGQKSPQTSVGPVN